MPRCSDDDGDHANCHDDYGAEHSNIGGVCSTMMSYMGSMASPAEISILRYPFKRISGSIFSTTF